MYMLVHIYVAILDLVYYNFLSIIDCGCCTSRRESH